MVAAAVLRRLLDEASPSKGENTKKMKMITMMILINANIYHNISWHLYTEPQHDLARYLVVYSLFHYWPSVLLSIYVYAFLYRHSTTYSSVMAAAGDLGIEALVKNPLIPAMASCHLTSESQAIVIVNKSLWYIIIHTRLSTKISFYVHVSKLTWIVCR